MAYFDDGVKSYVKAVATITVSFPVDFRGKTDISCFQCPYFRRNYQTCGLNGAICEYPKDYVGSQCPLTPVQEEQEDT